MAKVILFGGGDGGGLIIGPNGVRPIPPFDPAIRLQLRGLSALMGGISGMSEKSGREMAKLANRVSNLLITEIEEIVGPLEGEQSLVYQDADGGFTCGSTGKPPLPFPWPPQKQPALGELIAAGVLEHQFIDFVRAAGDAKIAIRQMLEEPAAVARKLGMKLSEQTIQDLQQLAPSHLEKIKEPVDREIVMFFHKVAEDGRFLSSWATRPYEAAKHLKVELSDHAFDRILAGGASISHGGGERMNPVAVAVAVGVVIMLVTHEAGHGKLLIKDSSGVAKF